MAMDLTRGEVVGADFEPEGGDGSYILVHIAVPADTLISAGRVIIDSEEDFDRKLPSMNDVRGILADPRPSDTGSGQA